MKVLALVDAPDHVCCRYRIRAFEPALRQASVNLTTVGLSRSSITRTWQLASARHFDVVLLQRKLLPLWQLGILRKFARRLIFDYDDAVLYRDSFDTRGPISRRRAARFAQTVKLSDTVIAGNDFLADCALRQGAKPKRVRVIPTCVEPARYPLNVNKFTSQGLELTWIGSSSTLQGLERERGLWEQLGERVPGLRLRIICDRFPQFQHIQVIEVPWSEATEAEDLSRADVGLGWMPDDLWSRGKCGLKVLQYGAAGLPVVANPIGVHSEMIEPGVNGFLPRSADDWVHALNLLASDVECRQAMGSASRQMIDSRYSIDAWSSTFVSTVAGGRALNRPNVIMTTSHATRPLTTN